ncbi:MAG: antibiotic biosynthesis monooxygenase [Clostridia bacterium]|nr:antibiotic biosynthesis monooxygenase [Clostridia bacterium]
MYTIYVTFTCYPGKREAFVERVRKEGILDAVLAEDGCHCYDYYFSEKDPNLLLLLETWETKEHQQVHISQPHMDKLRSFNKEYISASHLGEFELK